MGLGDFDYYSLGNAIPVDKLIPTKYINAYVENCSINNLTGNIGTNNDKIENSGGFIGQQKGTVVKITKLQTATSMSKLIIIVADL